MSFSSPRNIIRGRDIPSIKTFLLLWQVLQSLKCSCGRFRFWLLRYLSFFLLFPTCFVSNTFFKTFFRFFYIKNNRINKGTVITYLYSEQYVLTFLLSYSKVLSPVFLSLSFLSKPICNTYLYVFQ